MGPMVVAQRHLCLTLSQIPDCPRPGVASRLVSDRLGSSGQWWMSWHSHRVGFKDSGVKADYSAAQGKKQPS